MLTTITNKASSMTKIMKPRVQNYQMTGEYVRLGEDGVNTLLGEYSLTFQDKPSVINALDDILSELNSTTPFRWNPYINFLPSSLAKVFICEEWEVSDETEGKSVLVAKFKEQPDIY